MTAPGYPTRSARLFQAALLALLIAGILPQPALADDPPPVTVPTPTVPAPTPDTAPKPVPTPAPRYRPTPTRTYSPPKYTPAQSYPTAPQPARSTVQKPVATSPKGATTPKRHPVVPIVPIRAKSVPTRARAKFRPAASERVPTPVRQTVVPPRDKKGGGGGAQWVLLLLLALVAAAALIIAGRSRHLRPYLSRLTSLVRNLLESAEPARLSVARVVRQATTADARRLIPRDLLARVTPRLRERASPARQLFARLLPKVSPANTGRLVPQGALRRVESRLHRQALAPANDKAVPLEICEPAPEVIVAPVPQPAVARLEPIATVEAFPEPEFAATILSPAPSPKVAERAEPALPTEEICEIAVWRGYRKSCFYARLDVAARGEDEGSAVAESTPFRYSGNGTLEQTEAAEAAHRTLVEELMTQGWEPCESAGSWYAARFSRPLVAWAGR